MGGDRHPLDVSVLFTDPGTQGSPWAQVSGAGEQVSTDQRRRKAGDDGWSFVDR